MRYMGETYKQLNHSPHGLSHAPMKAPPRTNFSYTTGVVFVYFEVSDSNSSLFLAVFRPIVSGGYFFYSKKCYFVVFDVVLTRRICFL